ncbi:MAG: class I SAM-dependent methyltransferase [Actinobacteria bacterium]|nr:class I SAM-dependent methyltransferase [Actinomycetota bacterium]
MNNGKMSNLHFKGMSVLIYLRDRIRPRDKVLVEVEIGEGSKILDYGCGPGSYTILAAKAAGDSGRVYALDIQPLASEMVEAKAARENLANIEIITSDCATGLPDNSMDVVFLYDIFHMLDNREEVLRELHRVLKPDGVLSFSDHHMKKKDIENAVTGEGMFIMAGKGNYTYRFLPAG